jgi:hypothetical protein
MQQRKTMFRISKLMAVSLAAAVAFVATGKPANAQPAPKVVTKPYEFAKKFDASRSKIDATIKYRDFLVSLNRKVLNYALQNLGKQVDRGECWDLAKFALEAAGAKVPGRDLATYVFGRLLGAGEAMQPGDIMQFEGVRFQTANSWQEMGHHTAIIERVEGSKIHLLQQNVNGNRTVQRGVIDLNTKVRGTIMTYRPLAK